MIFRNHLLKLLPTICCSILIGLWCAQKGAGFFLYLVIPFLFGWLIYCAYLFLRKPSERISQLLKIGVWCFVLAGVFITHEHYRTKSREAADSVASAVSAYHIKNGAFPPSLVDARVNLSNRGGPWRIIYLFRSKDPSLLYPSTFSSFDKYHYDFAKSEWVFLPD
jgi:hypothetical protein